MTTDRRAGRMTRSRRRLTRLVARLPVPVSADIEALCLAVAQSLDRPVRLIALPLPADAPCGLVITTKSAHHIAYDDQTTPLHQRHIVAHELGHLLAQHNTSTVLDADAASLLMPTLDPQMVLAVLTRLPGYDAKAEWEAEFIADLLWRHTSRRPADTGTHLGPDVDPASAELVRRIRQSLTGE